MNTWAGAIEGWRYDPRALTPRRDRNYGEKSQRLIRYDTANAYYHNTIYDKLNAMAARLKEDERLYKFIRGIYNPVPLENGLYVSYTYKGTIDTQTLKGGSMPLRYENTRLEDPIRQVVKWSNLDQQLGTYVKDAALLGDAAWWICDEPDKRRVRLELIDPARIIEVQRDNVGNIKAAVIEYRKFEEPDAEHYQPSIAGGSSMLLKALQPYTYTMIVTQDSFKTFKNGKPYAYYNDEKGNPVPAWDNIYGFVPLKLAYFTMGQDGWGQNSFFGAPRRQIDEINDLTSIIDDSMRNTVVPLLQAKGISAPTATTPANQKISFSRDERTDIPIIYIPGADGELKAVTMPLDFASASAHRATLVAELDKSLPIMALSQIRSLGGRLSGTAIENMFGDSISAINNLRKNLDPGLVGALQMAISIGGIQGYDGFEAFNEYSYDNGDMEMTIADRAVIDDRMDKSEKVTNLIAAAALPSGTKKQILIEMDYSPDVVDEIIATDKEEADINARNAVRGAMSAIFPANLDNGANGGTSTPPKVGAGQEQPPKMIPANVGA